MARTKAARTKDKGKDAARLALQWERDVLHTPMMNIIGECLGRHVEGLRDAGKLLRSSRTLSGRQWFIPLRNPIFRTLERFRKHFENARFVDGDVVRGVL